jgi:hypothetical protein
MLCSSAGSSVFSIRLHCAMYYNAINKKPKMTKKQRKREQKSFANILDAAGTEKPEGEDYFAFSVIIDDPTNPNWNSGYTFTGSWEQARALAGMAVNAWCADKNRIGKSVQIAMYQGDGAREYLKHSFMEELRYQKEVSTN